MVGRFPRRSGNEFVTPPGSGDNGVVGDIMLVLCGPFAVSRSCLRGSGGNEFETADGDNAAVLGYIILLVLLCGCCGCVATGNDSG